MDRLDEMLQGIGELLKQRDNELLVRISELEKRVEELEERVAKMEEEDILEGGEPEVEVEFDFGVGEDDDWADEYQEGDVIETDIEEAAEEVIGDYVEEDAEDGAVEEAEDDGGVDVEEDAVEVVEESVEEAEEVADIDELAEEEFFFKEDSEETVGNIGLEQQGQVLVVDKARPEWYDWEVDIPGEHIDDIWEGIGLNDRMLFLRELFDGNDDDFKETVSALNDMERLVQATEFIRDKYPHWNEESDEVYRFYMTVRRRFNKQKQEG